MGEGSARMTAGDKRCTEFSEEISLSLLREVAYQIPHCKSSQCRGDAIVHTGIVHQVGREQSHSRKLVSAVGRIVRFLQFTDESRVLVAEKYFGHSLTVDKRNKLFQTLRNNGFNCVIAVSYSHGVADHLARMGIDTFTVSESDYAKLGGGVIHLSQSSEFSPPVIFAYTNPRDPTHAICIFPKRQR